jgi:hypothetical protein
MSMIIVVFVHVSKLKMNNAVGEFSCYAHTWTYNILPSIWNSLLCCKEQSDEFHRRDSIIMGDCPMCGIQLLWVCPKEFSTNKKT